MADLTGPENNLMATLKGEYTLEFCGGEATLHCTRLPSDTVSAAVRLTAKQSERLGVDPGLHVFLDLDKPSAAKHARWMLHEWLNVTAVETDDPVLLRLGRDYS